MLTVFLILCMKSFHIEALLAQHVLHDHELEHTGIQLNMTGFEDNTDFEDIKGTGINGTEEAVNVTYYNNLLNDTWLNLVGVMDLFTQREYDNSSAVQALTAAYRYTLRQQKKLRTLPAYLKKPFVAIEGLDVEKRDTLAKRLSLHLGGYVVDNPPDTFDVVLKHLPPNSTQMVNGFYVLSTYIAALHVRYVVQKAPAIVPGYWLGRAAETIATHFLEKPPPYESKFWTWPRDLVKPDVVFYLTDKQFIDSEDRKFARRYLHIFDNWIDPKCVPLVNLDSMDSLIEEMDPHLKQFLRHVSQD